MMLRSLGFQAQELEAGPFVFFLSDSIPVAYRQGDQWFRTDAKVRKGQTRQINKWLDGRPAVTVPDAQLRLTFASLSRFTPEPPDRRQIPRRSEDNGRLVGDQEYLEFQLWKAQRRIQDLEAQLHP